jgi:predicted transcriptional regulator
MAKEVPILFRAPEELSETLARVAEAHDRSKASMLRELIRQAGAELAKTTKAEIAARPIARSAGGTTVKTLRSTPPRKARVK